MKKIKTTLLLLGLSLSSLIFAARPQSDIDFEQETKARLTHKLNLILIRLQNDKNEVKNLYKFLKNHQAKIVVDGKYTYASTEFTISKPVTNLIIIEDMLIADWVDALYF